MNFCSNCGTKLEQGVQFCPECGKQLKNSQDARLHEKLEEMIEQEVAQRVDRELAENDRTDRRQTKLIRIALAAIAAVCLLLFAFGSNIFSKNFSEDTEAIENASKSVVKLYCYDRYGVIIATGSGFSVFDDGIILTNYHVIQSNVYDVVAECDNGLRFTMDYLVAYDEAMDIAILKTNSKTELKNLVIESSPQLERGENLVAIGSPLGLRNTVSKGVFSGYVQEDGIQMLQFTAAISSGSSGGALFNDKGRVIGITTASYVDGQNMNLAVPIEYAEDLWERRDLKQEIPVTKHGIATQAPYSAGWILSNSKSYLGKEVQFYGYISSIIEDNGRFFKSCEVYVVNQPEQVLGVYTDGVEEFMDVQSQYKNGESIKILTYEEFTQRSIGKMVLIDGSLGRDPKSNTGFIISGETIEVLR